MAHTELKGTYRITHLDLIIEKALRADDPRHVFYRAMLEHPTYEAYLAAVGSLTAHTGDRVMDNTSGRDEILYARRNGWVADGV